MASQSRTYKQPSRFNGVSITLLVLALVAGYVGFSSWPVIALNADVNNAIEDALPKLYRANLLPEPEATLGSDQVRQMVIEKLGALGVTEPDAATTFTRDGQIVAIAVRVTTAIELKLIGKKIPVKLNPRVETSAARVTY